MQNMAARKPYQDPEKLRELYHGKGLTTREIGDRLGCTGSTVSRYLDKYDIDTRENWKAGVEKAKHANRKEYVELRQFPSGYMYWSSKEQTESGRVNRIVYVHRLLAIAEYGFDAVCNNDVHHNNGYKFDNRPANIELLDKAEHARKGNSQRISKDELLAEIRRLDDLVDGEPTSQDLREHGKFSWPTYKDRFGGWSEAKEAAGV